MSKMSIDAEYTARMLERIAQNEEVQKRIMPKITGKVDNDCIQGLVAMRIEDKEKLAKDNAFKAEEILSSTTFGKFTIAVRKLLGLPAVSRKSIATCVFRKGLLEEAEKEVGFQAIIKKSGLYKRLNSPTRPHDFPDAETMKIQPAIAYPDEDSDPTRKRSIGEIIKDCNELMAYGNTTVSSEKEEPFYEATKKPEPSVPPPPPPPLDTKVNVTIIQGIIFYELPIPTSFNNYDREDLTDSFRDYYAGDVCNLVEKNVLFVIYWYGAAPYEGAGDLVVVFDDGSVDTIGLGHCSYNGPLDDLSAVKRGAYKDIATFRQSVSQEARERDYSTILAFVDGGYELSKVDAPGAQTIQEFPGFAYATGQPSQNPSAPITGGVVNFSISYKENKPAKKRAKKAKKKVTKKSAKRKK